MRALLRAEWLKLRSTRSTRGLLLAAFALTVLTVVVNIPHAGPGRGPLSLDDPTVLADVMGIGFGVPVVLMVLLGTLAFTQEFRYGTMTSSYLAEPRRRRVLLAKWLSLVLAGFAVAVAALVLTGALGAVLLDARGGRVTSTGHLFAVTAGAFPVMAAYGLIGVALGALVRNQVAAVVGVLVWLLAVEQIVILSFPAVGRWMPGGASDALLGLGPALDLDGKLLSPAGGGLLLFGYAAAAVVSALAVVPRRDVL